MIRKLFSENTDISMMRVMMFFVIVDIMLVWTITCIKSGSFLEMSPDTVAIIGTMVAGKVAQKFGEKKPGAAISNESTKE